MKLSAVFAAPVLLTGLLACNPVYNWREVRLPEARVKLMLPCKPDAASRKLSLAGQPVLLQMNGCEAGGALFVFAYVKMPVAGTTEAGVAQWKSSLFSNMQAQHEIHEADYSVKNLGTRVQAQRFLAKGTQENGKPVEAQAIWFSRGADLYHAAIYAEKPNQDAVENFLSEIELE